MKLTWEIEEKDIRKIKDFIKHHEDNPFVKLRVNRNLNNSRRKFSPDLFWCKLITCLLTTQQKSGPKSPVHRFIHTKPFPLTLDCCSSKRNLRSFCEKTIKEFGGIRMHVTISDSIIRNLEILNSGFWCIAKDIHNKLTHTNSINIERESAKIISDNLRGFGPKQSRNLLQSLGLTRYEIPIDSRVTKWLNEFGFPVYLSATMLSDQHYYDFIMDGIQQLCQKCEIYPCILDAAIFASFDKEPWLDTYTAF